MALLIETFRVFRDMARGYAGWRRRQSVRFEHAVLIEAPRATVWQSKRVIHPTPVPAQARFA